MKITKNYLKKIIKEEMHSLGEVATREEQMKKYGLLPDVEAAKRAIMETEVVLEQAMLKFNQFFKTKPVEQLEDLYGRIEFLKELINEPED
jgi:hypothetical protein